MQLDKPDYFSTKCKFFQEEQKVCTIKMNDIEAIASFLQDKSIIKKVAADEWWSCF